MISKALELRFHRFYFTEILHKVSFTNVQESFEAATKLVFCLKTIDKTDTNLDVTTINGVNSRCLNRITVHTIHEEVNSRTHTYDLVTSIRSAHQIEMVETCTPSRATPCNPQNSTVIRQCQMNSEGNLFLDIPHYFRLNEIVDISQDRQVWKALQQSGPDPRVKQFHLQLQQSQARAHATTLQPSPRILIQLPPSCLPPPLC